MRLTAQQLEFLARLGKSPEGQQLQAMMQAEIDDVNLQLRTLTGEHLYRAQGKATYLDDLAAKLAASIRSQEQLTKRLAPGGFA
jgi:thioredoxin-like negative regulator of GroEL